jgi:hypothetical protein
MFFFFVGGGGRAPRAVAPAAAAVVAAAAMAAFLDLLVSCLLAITADNHLEPCQTSISKSCTAISKHGLLYTYIRIYDSPNFDIEALYF